MTAGGLLSLRAPILSVDDSYTVTVNGKDYVLGEQILFDPPSFFSLI
jgi:hypothetical protein